MVNDSNDEEKIYFRLADTTFKERYRNHIRDFKHEKYKNSTELAKYIWQLKHDNISFSVNPIQGAGAKKKPPVFPLQLLQT